MEPTMEMEGMDQSNNNNNNGYLENSNTRTHDQLMEDAELEAIKVRVREMEEEAEKLKLLQSEVEKCMLFADPKAALLNLSLEAKLEADARSVYVGNVDYSATAEELERHFSDCGSISRVTILCDKVAGRPKGYAYIEFADKDAVNTAMALDDSLLRGRQIKVMLKRTNRPGLGATSRSSAPRGRGTQGGRGHGFRPTRRPRGRRPSYFSPY